MDRIASGAALDELLDLMQDRHLIQVLSHQSPEAFFGEKVTCAPIVS